ncbi:paramyosin-like [Mytilus californianus]|uniref:paramyosin-like n=1 Tax=Mytilus californianus TaxID=6549 RepID=UPI0022458B1A|nr:paramyosin-like [Mytilus californianus]
MTTKYSKDCITKNIVFIKENIASVDRLLDILLEGDVIQMHEREDVVAKMPGERVHHMIDIVLKRRAQHIFIDALKRTGQTLIVDRILTTQKELAQIKEPKPHTISLLTPKIATYAPFHREHISLWQPKENMIERKSHDEYKSLLEIKRQNEARIKQLEHEMEKVKRTEKKRYKQLEKEYKELTKNNNELKAKVDELKIQLNARDEFIKTARSRSSYGQDEVDSPVKNSDRTFLDLKKSQENFENKLMKEMAKGQQQLLNIVQELSQKNVIQEIKLAEATDKLETATAKLNSVAEKIDNRLDGHDGRKSTSKSNGSTNLSEMTLPPLNKLGKHFSDALPRQNTFMDGVGVPHKFKE